LDVACYFAYATSNQSASKATSKTIFKITTLGFGNNAVDLAFAD
jgi:hypothetical protein